MTQLIRSRLRVAVIAAALCVPASASMQEKGASTGFAPDRQYQFIGYYKVETLRKELAEASAQGFAIHFAGDRSMLLKKDGSTPHTYTIVSEGSIKALLNELNGAGVQGFRLVPASATTFSTNYFVALEKQPDGVRFTYSAVKADEAGAMSIAAVSKTGKAFVSVASAGDKAWLIFEEVTGGQSSQADQGEREYRVAVANTAPKLEKGIEAAAAQGFRVIRAGYFAAVMERAGSVAVPHEYRAVKVASKFSGKVETAAIAQAGLDGFRTVGCLTPFDCLMEKPSVDSRKFQIRLELLKDETADAQLRGAEADGYRVVAFRSPNVAVLEKSVQ